MNAPETGLADAKYGGESLAGSVLRLCLSTNS
jgi:hypothetical protein